MDRGGAGMGGFRAEEEGSCGRGKTGNTDIGNYIHRLMFIYVDAGDPNSGSKHSTN